MTNEIDKKHLFNAIAIGHRWPSELIYEELTAYLRKSHPHFLSKYSWRSNVDLDDHYFYVNDCFLIVEDKAIKVRCERENVNSAGLDTVFDIDSVSDIETAFLCFYSATMEAEEDD